MEFRCWAFRWRLYKKQMSLRLFGFRLTTKPLLMRQLNVGWLISITLEFLVKIFYFFWDQVNVHWRDPQTALDTTSSIESVQEFLKNHPRVRNLALVQCTSPFITSNYLRKAIKIFSKRHCAFSAVKSFKLRWRREGSSNRIIPVNFNYTKRPRRQDWDGT